MRGIDRRLRKLEQRTAITERAGKLVVFCAEEWPADVQTAYYETRYHGDRDAEDEIIERMTGDRPVRIPGTVTVIVCHKPTNTY
jgi:hypothetical protein